MTPKRKTTKGIDKSWHPRFLEILGRSLNVTLAARGSGVTRNTAYIHKHQFPDFASAWEDALQEAIERLEGDAYERARKQSDVLTIFLLKSHKPEKYREQLDLNVKRMSDAELIATVTASLAGDGAAGLENSIDGEGNR